MTATLTPTTARVPLGTVAHRTSSGPTVVGIGRKDPAAVLRAARYISSISSNGILAVSALEPMPASYGGDVPVLFPMELEEQRKADRLIELASQVTGASNADDAWRSEVLIGGRAYALADVARAERAPLIVMGIGRRRPIDRLLGGETTLRTIQRASCPVLAVSQELGPPFHEVVIATDFSAGSAFAAECALPLLAPDAVIHLVHVWQRTAFVDAPPRGADERYMRTLPARFRRLRELLGLPESVTVHEEIREGHTAERLLDYATAHGADLIVAGRQGLNMFSRFLVGSVSGALLRGAQCSVLIAPEPGFIDLDRLHRRMDGASESHRPAEWMVQLDEFSRRNIGRRTTVEVIDATIGAQVLEAGFALQGATYDPNDRRVELMLGNGEPTMHHVTRAIGNVESVTIATDARGCDLGMSIAHGTGQTVLTFWRE